VISDLVQDANTRLKAETDVLIVGAGIAGILLGVRLRQSGVRVIILESGNYSQPEEVHPLNRTVRLGQPYNGASSGRRRCLGGTSTIWGGALIPFAPSDLLARDYLGLSGFPVGPNEIEAYIPDLEKVFGVDAGSYEEQFVAETGIAKYVPTGDPDFKARFAKWPSFKKRNIATLFRELIKADDGLRIVLNSTAVKFDVDRETGVLRSVTARHASGRSIDIVSKHCVICAGAIESTRLLLALDRQNDERFLSASGALGRYFYDHHSRAMASIEAKDVGRLNRLAGFRFVESTMRSLRFELDADAQRRERVPNAFGHISFKTDKPSAFDALRQFMRSRQMAVGAGASELGEIIKNVPYLAKLGFWRFGYRQLLWPRPATYDLHVVAEQVPHYENSIKLAEQTDIFGMPLAAINWRVFDADLKPFLAYKRLFDAYWNRQGLARIGALNWTDASTIADKSLQVDVFHPGGTTRMGTESSAAVVDSELRVFNIRNLWTASTATFPSGGGANPTMTLMLFTLRLADRLSRTIIAERQPLAAAGALSQAAA
jgi:choline dehydrogenase-like flavoprotein